MERQAVKNEQGQRKKDMYVREFPRAKAATGDLVLVKEATSILRAEGRHLKLVHDHSTGPWKVVSVIRKRLIFIVQLNDRKVR